MQCNFPMPRKQRRVALLKTWKSGAYKCLYVWDVYVCMYTCLCVSGSSHQQACISLPMPAEYAPGALGRWPCRRSCMRGLVSWSSSDLPTDGCQVPQRAAEPPRLPTTRLYSMDTNWLFSEQLSYPWPCIYKLGFAALNIISQSPSFGSIW
jgi:hypothetical protein